MATVFEADDGRFELSRVFSRAFGAISRNPATFIGLALLLQLLPALVLSLVGTSVGPLIRFVILLVNLYLSLSLNGALIRATILDGAGERADFATSLRTGFKVAVPLFGIAILFGLAVGFATLLLIVPGMILLTIWAVVFPAYVAENPGVMGVFGRSAALTKGERWKIFGLIVVAYLLIAIPIALLSSFTGGFIAFALASASFGAISIINSVVNLITVVVFTAVQAALYVELRQAKEGTSAATLAQVFA